MVNVCSDAFKAAQVSLLEAGFKLHDADGVGITLKTLAEAGLDHDFLRDTSWAPGAVEQWEWSERKTGLIWHIVDAECVDGDGHPLYVMVADAGEGQEVQGQPERWDVLDCDHIVMGVE